MLLYRFAWAIFMVCVVVPAGFHASDLAKFASFADRISSVDQLFYFQNLISVRWISDYILFPLDYVWTHLIGIFSVLFPNSATIAALKSEWFFCVWLFIAAGLVQPPFYVSELAWPEEYAARRARNARRAS